MGLVAVVADNVIEAERKLKQLLEPATFKGREVVTRDSRYVVVTTAEQASGLEFDGFLIVGQPDQKLILEVRIRTGRR